LKNKPTKVLKKSSFGFQKSKSSYFLYKKNSEPKMSFAEIEVNFLASIFWRTFSRPGNTYKKAICDSGTL